MEDIYICCIIFRAIKNRSKIIKVGIGVKNGKIIIAIVALT